MRLSEHINTKYDNVLCSCCGNGADILDQELITMFEKLRSAIGKFYGKEVILEITSGFRCIIKNQNLKRQGYPAAKNSLHLSGQAFDIIPHGITSAQLVKFCQKLHAEKKILTGGLGVYNWGIHIDTGRRRNWDYRK